MSEDMNWNDNKRYDVVDLSKEMKTSFLDYSMSVIVSRALPDVRDGLKPVQRRILYGMNELGVTPDKPYKKSARIVGDVMGKYHPHGDSAIYEAMVRMAQNFSYRQMLVDGHGNFGSIDGHGAAAMRYTEARLSKIALEMLRDINKDTVDFQDNYSQEEQEPSVLPARFPNLLVNGASGIAVGMATNIPPHNLGEVIDALILYMENEDVTLDEMMEVLPGPDFPTGGIIVGKSGIKKAYKTGRGKIIVRSKVEIEELRGGAHRIVVSEIPYGVNKARLVQRIAELARDKEIEGITYANDETDREGLRVVIEVHRDHNVNVVLNNLFKYTQMQVTFGVNMLAIDGGVPKVLNLKEILAKYLDHQEEVIIRRTKFDKKKAEDRAHILEGLRVALDHIDEIINIIRSSPDGNEAKVTLIDRFKLTEIQAQAILDMRLVRLTGLERDKIEQEYSDLIELIERLNEILASRDRVLEIIHDELIDIKTRYNDERRTEIRGGEIVDIDDEDLIDEEEVLVVLTNNGYIKRLADDTFNVQNRGGRGVKGMGIADDDSILEMVSGSTHDVFLFFTNTGRVFSTRGYEIPEYGRTAKGIPVQNLLKLADDESIRGIIAVEQHANLDKDERPKYLFFVTKNGTVKRSETDEYYNIRSNGLIALNLRDDDELVAVMETNGGENVIIGTREGYAVSFNEEDVRVMGRTATGVRGARLRESDYVIGAGVLDLDGEVLTITEKGYGKRTPASEYGVKSRGTKGIVTSRLTKRSGKLAGIKLVTSEEDDLMVMTKEGIVIRFNISDISVTGRNATGVRLIRLDENDFVSAITVIDNSSEDEVANSKDDSDKEVVEDSTDDDVDSLIEDQMKEQGEDTEENDI